MKVPRKRKWIDRGSYSKLILFNQKELGSKALVQLVRIKPKSRVEPHYHKQTKEIFYILEGNAFLYFNGRKIKAKPGKVFLCEPGDVHGVFNPSKKELSLLVFKINPKEKDFYKN